MVLDTPLSEKESELLSEKVKRQMNKPLIHESWESTYRNEENERFFEQAYDYIVGVVRQPQDSLALDIGCGIGANSVRLARRGYRVVAADYSESIIEPAHQNVEQKGVADRVEIRREDILNLSFPDAQFDLVLCWGVLMHIPAAERALSQLIRVAKAGGYIVLEEINAHAPEALLMRVLAAAQGQADPSGENSCWRGTPESVRRRDLVLEACGAALASGSVRASFVSAHHSGIRTVHGSLSVSPRQATQIAGPCLESVLAAPHQLTAACVSQHPDFSETLISKEFVQAGLGNTGSNPRFQPVLRRFGCESCNGMAPSRCAGPRSVPMPDWVMVPGKQDTDDSRAIFAGVDQIAEREFAASMLFVDDPVVEVRSGRSGSASKSSVPVAWEGF